MTLVTIYVPSADYEAAQGRDLGIKEGSAIVGTESESPSGHRRVTVDYEGNLYGALNAELFRDKLCIAAGRHVDRYPTIARTYLPAEAVLPVGQYDTATNTVYVDDSEKLESWIGAEAFALLVHHARASQA